MNRNSPIEPACREAFIPYPRRDILQLCLEDGGLAEQEIAQFQAFCEILAALFHFQFHRVLEEVKESYRVFDPNTDVFLLYEPNPHRIQQMSQKVGTAFKSILQRANYVPLTTAALHEALDSPALLNLKTDIDFNDFEQVLCYYRGKSEITITQKRLHFWTKQQTVQLFERLVLLIQFKDEAYFQAQSDQRKRPIAPRQFIPGKTYLFFYKNLPRPDLRLLFPNVRTRIPTKDQLLFTLPAAIMAMPLALKLLLNTLLILAASLVIWHPGARQVTQSDSSYSLRLLAIVVGFLLVVFTSGNFLLQQYNLYNAKRIQLQKGIIETLFFKSLGTNGSVFQILTDLAEEEESKEILLVYYHLLVSSEALTPEALKARIENWLLETTGSQVDFQIHNALQTLKTLGRIGRLPILPSLLSEDNTGHCQVLSLAEANAVLDQVWDNLFRYK